MKYHAMWHPQMRWGPTGIPVLLLHKRDVARGTGLTLKKVRELGWTWVTIEMPNPGDKTFIQKVDEYAEGLLKEANPELHDVGLELKEMIDEDRIAGDDGDTDSAVSEEDRGDSGEGKTNH